MIRIEGLRYIANRVSFWSWDPKREIGLENIMEKPSLRTADDILKQSSKSTNIPLDSTGSFGDCGADVLPTESPAKMLAPQAA